ncbi:MAG: hypothetical protein DRJ57_06550 [Thermoprotei archaeon]|nr:MAG: hypothetical protein DRJ67_08555 [Thermoprotei archaeon]RLE95543.1 MAG: hypothetical protein DRJ57_06550 [Thermoprotei archaeon]
MELEVEGRRFKLDWKDIAMLLVLLWVRTDALALTHLQRIEPDYGRLNSRIARLLGEGLIEEVRIGRLRFFYLSELGVKVAKKLEELAKKLSERG